MIYLNKKNFFGGIYMNAQIKRLSLLILCIAFLLLGVFAQSEPSIPTNFTTYTDEEGLFRISYPANWEPDLSRIKTLKQETEEYLKSISSRGTLEKSNIVFFGGIPLDSGYNPNISIVIVPLGNEKVNLEVLEYVLESAVQGFKKDAEEFHEFSRITTIIDGKQAMLLESEARYPNLGSLHLLHTFLSDERFFWIITCSVGPPLNFYDFKDDLYAIVKSFQILNK